MFDYDHITKIELVEKDEITGTPVPTQFRLTDNEKRTAIVPAEPTNIQYPIVREWYNRRKKPGFEYKFEDDPQPGKTKAEISAAAPPVEADDQGADPAKLVVSATQTKAVNLPEVNLTREQRAEIKDRK